jgi:anti-sigma factor RsiW
MTHPDMETQVDAYLDGELAARDAAELEAHLAGCPSCGRFREDRLALRAAITAELPRLDASDLLRGRVRAALRRAATPTGGRRSAPPVAWLALAASVVLIVGAGSWRLAVNRTAADALSEEVLASHVRSLMPGHLSDVVSTDQHTVKPWFNGKLDFSPPVYDFTGRGYPLLGGRLDYLGGRPVAALVYGRRKHLINVFLWPSTGPAGQGAPETRQGYHLLHWATPEYTYWVASDLGATELADFATLLRLGDSVVAR